MIRRGLSRSLRSRPNAQLGADRVGGFTLIELMVVVAVVAILASVALPSYQESVRKGRRGQAKADLVAVAQEAERYRTVNNTYAGFTASIENSPVTGTPQYEISVDVGDDGRTFTAVATPVATSSQASDRCGALSINQAGTKQHSKGSIEQCQFGKPSE